MRPSLRKLKKKAKNVSKRTWRNYALLIVAIGIFFGGAMVVWVSTFKIPTLDSFAERQVVQSTKIYDRTGETLLYDVNQEIKRTVVPFESISRHVKNATIAIEDREFYNHNGVRPTSFIRATLANILSLSFSQGGSTITQQVVKNSLLSSEKLISRKIKEWVLAIRLEKILTKDEILHIYLNESPYGGAIYGIEEASQTFFGKSAADLSIAEAAYLASLPQAPSYYSPYGNHREDLDQRKNLVLHEMLENKFITESEYEEAKAVVVEFKPRPDQGIRAPHFVFYVIEELEKTYGEDLVRNGGLRVITTLDYDMQAKAEEIAEKYALENEEKFNAENMAFVAIDPKTGGILTMVGSRNYFDEAIEGNFNIATAHRQPGSTFKPFVYATAFNKGYTPETILFDVRTQFSTSCTSDNTTSVDGCYSPGNYDNIFRGPVTIRNALAQSINVPAVKALYLAGIRSSIELAENMGIQSLTDPGRYGLTLVLGGGEVSLLDMVSSYGVFANEGIRNPYNAILEVRDGAGRVIEKYEEDRREVLPRETALMISDILADNVARAPAFGQTSQLYFPNQDVAVKTGTTDDYKDAWIIGYTPSVVLGAWAGNNDNTSMEKRVAGFIIAPAWRALMDTILAKIPNEQFPPITPPEPFTLKPVLRGVWQGGISNLIDSVSRKRATEYTPRETIVESLAGGIHSILYWVNKDDPRGPAPANPDDDSQFRHWEYGVMRWLASQGISQPADGSVPREEDDVHTESARPEIRITEPRNREEFSPDEEISVSLSYRTESDAEEARFFVNGNLVGTVDREPFSFTFTPEDLPFISSRNTLRVVLYDKDFNNNEDEIVFEVNDD